MDVSKTQNNQFHRSPGHDFLHVQDLFSYLINMSSPVSSLSSLEIRPLLAQ